MALMIVLVTLIATACGDDDSGDGGNGATTGSGDAGLRVVATTTIVADLARNVAGDQAEVSSLLPANADPHDFEPAPGDVEQAADADLILEHGMDLDVWIEGLVEESGTDAPVAVVTDGVRTIAAADGDNDIDPHVWFDVANANVMVGNIRDALAAADPDNADTYAANADAYLAELDELDGWIREQISTIPEADRRIVTNHDAFGYYVDAYGLELVGTVIPSLDTQAQASAQETAALLDLIESEGVRAIFAENTVSPDVARQLADEAGIEIVDDLYSDALGDEDSDAPTYIDLMRWDTTQIVDALT
jgi:zinc/manganese transport system substrate-binding protein/manganese/iron transport system substrate-binding protein